MEANSPVHPAGGIRFCVHCGRRIPGAVMVRARFKAIFCQDPQCKLADRNAIRSARERFRQSRGLCLKCGAKPRNARVQTRGIVDALNA
jgi:hypothetical protein